MDENQAMAVAEALGGEPWQSGGDIWLVVFRREDGRVVCLSDESAGVYENEDELEAGQPVESIILH